MDLRGLRVLGSCAARRAAAALGVGPDGWSGYDGLRIALAMLLLAAAALKAHQLATEPTPAEVRHVMAEVRGATSNLASSPFRLWVSDLLDSRWTLVGVVEFEILIGLLLFSGSYARRVWAAAIACFAAFAGVAAYKAFCGEPTCGCFGKLPVNPWWTLLLDSAVVLALVRWRPPHPVRPVPLDTPSKRVGRRLAAVVFGWCAVAALAGWAMVGPRATTIDEAGGIVGEGGWVLLEPETWVGRSFPLLGYTDFDGQLASGEWSVVLYHHDCPECKRFLAMLERMARQGTSPFAQIVLAEVPPYKPQSDRNSANQPWIHGRLKDVREWLVETPVAIELRNGQVGASAIERDSPWSKAVPCPAGKPNACPPQAAFRRRTDAELVARKAAEQRAA